MSTINVNRVVDSSGGVLAPISSVHRNRIINGAMVIDQRNAGASVTPSGSAYTLDRWQLSIGVASKLSVQQSSTAPIGFKNSTLITTASAYTASAGDYLSFCQKVEGFNIADLDWGTANAKTITVSFWVRSSLTGTFSGALQNSGASRSYPFIFSVLAANTFEYKTVTIEGDTGGTWLSTNGTGIEVHFNLGSGSDRLGTAGAWNSNWNTGATGSVALVQTLSATLLITGVQLEKGTQATSFEYRQIGQELALCQRYFEVHVAGGNNTGIMAMSTGSATSGRGTYVFKVQKRANPSSVAFLAANQYLYQGAGINTAPSGISIAVSSPSALLIDVTIAGATTNATANLLENSAAGANMISISAEL